MTKLLRFFRPSHQHTAFSATLLLMTTVMLSRVIGYAREAYIAYAFGAGSQTDAYVAAFTLPDFLNYIVAGGAASITFISIYTRFLAEKRDADARKTFSIIITVMTAVLLVGTVATEIFAPQFVRWFVKGFKPEQIELCIHLTRILLPAQIFFYVGGVAFAPAVPAASVWTSYLQRVHHSRRGGGRAAFRNCLAGLRSDGGKRGWSVSGERDWCGAHRNRIQAVV